MLLAQIKTASSMKP